MNPAPTTLDPPPARTLTPASFFSLVLLALAGCATMGRDPGQPLIPTQSTTRTGPFAVHSGTPLAPDAPPIRALQALERDLAANLGIKAAPDAPPIDVYILKDRDAFGHFLTFYYPELPPRRAFFLAQGPRRIVYAFHNDRLEEDLRHEATHAILHASVGDLPLWLDEGLAEFFEGPESRHGLNPEHVARLPDDRKAGWRPDLVRLEALESVGQMSPRDYRESWAWVHLLLAGDAPSKSALLSYLDSLRTTPRPDPLSSRLTRPDASLSRRLLTHLDRVQKDPAPVATTPKLDPSIHLQNTPLDPRPTPRRSALSRLLSALGLAPSHKPDPDNR